MRWRPGIFRLRAAGRCSNLGGGWRPIRPGTVTRELYQMATRSISRDWRNLPTQLGRPPARLARLAGSRKFAEEWAYRFLGAAVGDSGPATEATDASKGEGAGRSDFWNPTGLGNRCSIPWATRPRIRNDPQTTTWGQIWQPIWQPIVRGCLGS